MILSASSRQFKVIIAIQPKRLIISNPKNDVNETRCVIK